MQTKSKGITVHTYVTVYLSHLTVFSLGPELSLSKNMNEGHLRMFINGFVGCFLPVAVLFSFQ